MIHGHRLGGDVGRDLFVPEQALVVVMVVFVFTVFGREEVELFFTQHLASARFHSFPNTSGGWSHWVREGTGEMRMHFPSS